MNQLFENSFSTNGRVMYYVGSEVWKFYRGKIYKSEDNGKTWNCLFDLRKDLSSYLINNISMASRLLRRGVHHLIPVNKNELFVIYNKQTAILGKDGLRDCGQLIGSRPLSVLKYNDSIIYGEYRGNSERSEIGVWHLNLNHLESRWKKLQSLSEVRHIHGIYQDYVDSSIWITTGDDDNEAIIYNSNNAFESFEKILFGSQQTRAIKLLFDDNYVYFGSDAPDEPNYIYRLNKHTRKIDQLCQVGSSVFHGCKINNWLFFSTAIEPSKVNSTKYSEIWASPDGLNWKCILRLKKDMLPMKLFQYGQIFFPEGMGNDLDLWFSPFATESEGLSFKLPLIYIEELFNSGA